MRALVASARLHLGAHGLLPGGNTPWKRWATCAERSWRPHWRTSLTMSQHAREIAVIRSYAAGSDSTVHQLLRGALASEEIPAAAPPGEAPPMLREDNSLLSGYVRTLAPCEMVLADRMTRAGQ